MRASWCHFEVRLMQATELAGQKETMRSRISAGNLSKVEVRLVPVCTEGELSPLVVGEPRSSDEIQLLSERSAFMVLIQRRISIVGAVVCRLGPRAGSWTCYGDENNSASC